MLIGEEHRQIKSEKLKVRSLQTQLGTTKEETFLFLSLMLKNHLKSIKQAVENFMGDHELHEIKKHNKEMERLIERFENNDSHG